MNWCTDYLGYTALVLYFESNQKQNQNLSNITAKVIALDSKPKELSPIFATSQKNKSKVVYVPENETFYRKSLVQRI